MRRRVAIIVGALCACVGATTVAAVGGSVPAGAQTGSRAVVVVDMGSLGGGVRTEVIEFSGSVSGMEALQLAGASPETITYGPLGQAVCKLYGAGDEPVPGRCPAGWVYFRAVGGAGSWSQSGLGASSTVVHDGDVEGWRYGGGAPPFQSFCAVVGCAPAPTTPTASPAGNTATNEGGTPAPGVSGTTTSPSGPGGTGGTGGTGAAAGAAGKPESTTTSAPRSLTSTGKARSQALAAGAGDNRGAAGGGGSPLGVVVALAVVLVCVGGGLAVRRRRQGTPSS